MYSFIAKLAFPFFFIGFLSIDSAFAQRLWDVRGLASSSSPNIRLVFPDNSEKIISRSDAIAIREMVDRYSKLSGIYPQIYLQSTNQYNAIARYGDKTPEIIIYMPMFDLFTRDKEIAASVLGHEMAHLYLGHHESSKTAEIAGEVIGFIAEVFLEALIQRNLGVSNLGSRIGASLGAATTATFSRGQEIDADELGLKWASTAGYDPLGAIRLFEFFDKNGMSTSYSFFNTHPTNADRIQNIRAIASAIKTEKANLARAESSMKTSQKAIMSELTESESIVALNNFIDQQLLKEVPKSDAAINGVKAFNNKNYSEAKSYFVECSQSGELICLNNLGVIYLNGLGVPKNIEMSLRLFKQAADGGSARSYFNYATTLTGKVSTSETLQTLEKASEMGSASAMGVFAWVAKTTQEMQKLHTPTDKLISYAKVSAMRGTPSGQIALGSYYRTGFGVEKNLYLAETNLKLAAPYDGRADGELYMLYDRDLKNPALAETYKKRIFDKKQVGAMSVVVGNYCKGAVSSYDNDCVTWLKESSLSGAPYSLMRLYGSLLFDGVGFGIKKDRIEGLSWIIISKNKGILSANNTYERLKPNLTDYEISMANKRAAEISASFSKNTN